VRAIAVEVRNENIRGIRLEGDTVIPVVDNRVFDDNIITAVYVPSISVLCRLRGSRSSIDRDLVENDVITFVHEIDPFRTVDHFYVADGDVCSLI
jgi:hypothetical protein